MREILAGLVLSMAVLFPNLGSAQVDPFRTPPPEASAADAAWQLNSQPIFFQGIVYYPTREYRIFDGQVMAQIGVYEGVPIYADTTLEPWSIIYFSVGRERMRAYERARDRELAGTSGSRASWYPSTPAGGGSAAVSDLLRAAPIIPSLGDRSVGTSGSIAAERPAGTGGAAERPSTAPSDIPERTHPTRTRIETIAPSGGGSSGRGGVWLNFNGDRWYSAGAAASFVPERFAPIGEYRGFPVYRENKGDQDRIWVSVVPDGPLAPYERR